MWWLILHESVACISILMLKKQFILFKAGVKYKCFTIKVFNVAEKKLNWLFAITLILCVFIIAGMMGVSAWQICHPALILWKLPTPCMCLSQHELTLIQRERFVLGGSTKYSHQLYIWSLIHWSSKHGGKQITFNKENNGE